MTKKVGMESNKPICPILSSARAIWSDCIEERCAWYDCDAEGCAIWALARLAQVVNGYIDSEQYSPAILTRSG